jgi:apolipoprotein D and lipocalin family protein
MLRLALLAATFLGAAFSRNSPAAPAVTNDPVVHIDPARFSGKWYSLSSIPTFLDKNWRQTIEHYTPRPTGGYDVDTTYRKVGETNVRHIRSTLFPTRGEPDGALRAQFFWPIKVPYRIIELPTDYAYMVGGSPDKRMLFILARTPTLPKATLDGIIARCRARGYAVEKLTSQDQRP